MRLTLPERTFGPFLLQEKSVVFRKKWAKEADKLEALLAKIPHEHVVEREELALKLAMIREVLDES